MTNIFHIQNYAVAMMARNKDGQLALSSDVIVALSEGEACEISKEMLMQRYPESEGWEGHAGTVQWFFLDGRNYAFTPSSQKFYADKGLYGSPPQ